MEVRDSVVEFIEYWCQRSSISKTRILRFIGLKANKYYQWFQRKGIDNQHNAPIPRWHWILPWEKEAILNYYVQHPLEGYRRLAYMALDDNVAAVSPSSVYRILKEAGVLGRRVPAETKKGTGFVQPEKPHEHWHLDISYLNITGTFYYMCSVLDGYSRYIVHHEIREAMKEQDVEIILQRAREKVPGAAPRIISDNGPQFIAKDFKEYIRESGMTHVFTSPFYPQSNGKLERWHQSIKKECIRPKTPTNLAEARETVLKYIEHYNNSRLHSAIGYIAPVDKLKGLEKKIFSERERKMREAAQSRYDQAA